MRKTAIGGLWTEFGNFLPKCHILIKKRVSRVLGPLFFHPKKKKKKKKQDFFFSREPNEFPACSFPLFFHFFSPSQEPTLAPQISNQQGDHDVIDFGASPDGALQAYVCQAHAVGL
jgi:hypothetical protein